jgi:rubrerythrin
MWYCTECGYESEVERSTCPECGEEMERFEPYMDGEELYED